MNTPRLAFLLIRLAIGISFFGHGLVRLPIMEKFTTGMIKQFEKSFLPQPLVTAFAYFLPFAELIIGLLVMLGLFLKQSALAGGFVMLALMFGTTTIQQWDSLTSQMVHLGFFALLLAFHQYDIYSVDKLRERNVAR